MKILFASVPADGHFNPLMGIAMHLKEAGHDVRWYAAPSYIPRLERLDIPYFPFVRATEVNPGNIALLYPERAKLKGPALGGKTRASRSGSRTWKSCAMSSAVIIHLI